MFKKRNSGRWQRKVGLHLSDRFSWVLRLVDNLPWFYTNWHWVHNRNSGVLGEYLCSAPVLLWIRSTLWTSTWGQGRGLFVNISASKVTTVTTIHPSIHPSILPCHLATGSQVRLRIADDSSQASHHFGAAVSLGTEKKVSEKRCQNSFCLMSIESIDTFQWNELCGTFCLSHKVLPLPLWIDLSDSTQGVGF